MPVDFLELGVAVEARRVRGVGLGLVFLGRAVCVCACVLGAPPKKEETHLQMIKQLKKALAKVEMPAPKHML